MKLKLGIAITTYNRKEMVCHLVDEVRRLTGGDYALAVCDDGSSDGTMEMLRARNEVVIGGTNKGIAWNKNRGIYYLLHVANCDVVLLLDDDVLPRHEGWQQDWIEAAWRYGHVNNSPPEFGSALIGGDEQPEAPGVASAISGWAYAYSRIALSQLGYLDLRFGRYGHEHSDFSFRAVRAGFGGFSVETPDGQGTYFYVIKGGLTSLAAASSGTAEELDRNGKLLGELGSDQVYRHAWRSDAEMRIFLDEIANAAPTSLQRLFTRNNRLDPGRYLELNPDVAQAGVDPILHYARFGLKESRKVE